MQIRQATASDAGAIGRIIGAVWAEESVETDRIAQAITSPDHATLLAVDAGSAVGFIDGFHTCAADETVRWEIDLVAVNPTHQGRGFGRKLIAACTEEGRRRGAHHARALIHVGNLHSQSAFARCMYQMATHTVKLVIAGEDAPHDAPRDARNAATPSRHLVPVETCRYKGVWLEQPLTEAGFRAARALQVSAKLETAGAVLPETVPAGMGWLALGHYRWWTHALRP